MRNTLNFSGFCFVSFKQNFFTNLILFISIPNLVLCHSSITFLPVWYYSFQSLISLCSMKKNASNKENSNNQQSSHPQKQAAMLFNLQVEKELTLNFVFAPQMTSVSLLVWCLWFPRTAPGRISPRWTEVQVTAPPVKKHIPLSSCRIPRKKHNKQQFVTIEAQSK